MTDPVDRHTRVRVYGAEETEEDLSFYERKKGAQGYEPVNMTAFREAERLFKKKDFNWESVLDLAQASQHPRVRLVKKLDAFTGITPEASLYELVGGGGFCFIPGALTKAQQKFWIKQAVTSYMKPNNLCSLDAHYEIPSEGFYSIWKSNETHLIARKDHIDDSLQTRALPRQSFINRDDIAALMRRMRWTTLGYQYKWTTKEYDLDSDPIPFPSDMAFWCRRLCEISGFGEFFAEAGIVNFYQPGDTLTGHVDRSELNMNLPLLSISLGASCIFLLGGSSRDDPVTPILLRSGDVVIMRGESRLYYHGVPRILDTHLDLADDLDDDDIKGSLEILKNGRININIRQVNQ